MADEARSAESTLADEHLLLDPAYNTDEDDKPPTVWELSDRVRVLVKKTKPDQSERAELANAVVRQLRTTRLFARVMETYAAASTSGTSSGTLNLYVLLFPGEGRDNTGIKDLNDKVLGYTLNNEYVRRRQQKIEDVFQPDFGVVGQDYKTAVFLTIERTRKGFDERLIKLDAALRRVLLDEILPNAEKGPHPRWSGSAAGSRRYAPRR